MRGSLGGVWEPKLIPPLSRHRGDADANVGAGFGAFGVNGQRFGVVCGQFFGHDGVLFDDGALGGIKGLVRGAGRE